MALSSILDVWEGSEYTSEYRSSTLYFFNPFHPSVAFHIETSHLICTANQMTGFYIKRNTGLKWIQLYLSVSFFSCVVCCSRLCRFVFKTCRSDRESLSLSSRSTFSYEKITKMEYFFIPAGNLLIVTFIVQLYLERGKVDSIEMSSKSSLHLYTLRFIENMETDSVSETNFETNNNNFFTMTLQVV